MFGRASHAPGVKLVTPCRLTGQPVLISTVQPRGAYWLVDIQHDFILGRFRCHSDVVINHLLTVMMFAARNDSAYVACLYRVISMLLHEPIGFVHPALIVCHRG